MAAFGDRIQDLMDEVYTEWQKEENKGKGKWDILGGFSAAHQIAVVLGNFNYQVGNGGISQWIYNGYFHDDSEKLIEYLEIGARLDVRCQTILDNIYKLDQYAQETDCDRDGYYYDEDGESCSIGDMIDIVLEFATQIVKTEYLNYSANTGVSIKKTGNAEAMSGDVMPYTIRELKNTSTVPLTDFYWRDVLPVDAVRLTKIVTGTFNQSLKYKIIATTNKGDTRVIADNLSTTKNNVIDCSNASLGLGSDEFVTSVTFVFGTVKAGFCLVEQPQIYVKVQPNLPNGYQFANKCDVAGKYGKEWVAGNSTWLTTIYAVPGKLPRTGY